MRNGSMVIFSVWLFSQNCLGNIRNLLCVLIKFKKSFKKEKICSAHISNADILGFDYYFFFFFGNLSLYPRRTFFSPGC